MTTMYLWQLDIAAYDDDSDGLGVDGDGCGDIVLTSLLPEL